MFQSLGLKEPMEGGHRDPLQYFCLENTMGRGAWRTPVHGVTKSWTPLSDQHTHLVSSKAKIKFVFPYCLIKLKVRWIIYSCSQLLMLFCFSVRTEILPKHRSRGWWSYSPNWIVREEEHSFQKICHLKQYLTSCYLAIWEYTKLKVQ